MHFHIITLFKEVCEPYTHSSIIGRAQKTKKGRGAKHQGKKIDVSYYNPRDFADGIHRKVDDRPYGGGPGMVMMAEPILKAWNCAVGKKKNKDNIKTLIMSPRGTPFNTAMAKNLARAYEHIVIISGRYEGIDTRVKDILNAEEVSVGDYVLTGGELPALTILDSVSRQIPGVLGTYDSLEETRVSSGEMYTRPETITYKKVAYTVPEVFKSGNHAEIERRKLR